MNINPIGNAGINYVAGDTRSQSAPAGGKPGLSQEALQKMESSIRSSFDTFESGKNSYEDYGIKLLDEQAPRKPGKDAKLSTTFTNEQVSEKAEALSWLMDERSLDIEARVGFGMSQEQLAQHFGEIGRQIDGAFAAGEITQQEYDDLNAGLGQYSEAVTSRAERQAAIWEVVKEMAKTTRAMVERGASKEEMAAYAQRNMDTFQDRLSEFVEKHCAIDRDLMAKLIKQVRGGEDLIPPGTQQFYGKDNMVGYFKNGYVPFQPVKYL